MDSKSEKIGVVTISDLTNYSPERVNFSICSVLCEEFDVDLVGPEQTSERIEREFDCYSYVPRSIDNAPLRKLLALPLTILTVVWYIREHRPKALASFGNLPVNGLCCALASAVTSTESVVRITSDVFEIWKYQESIIGKASMFVKHNLLGRAAIHLADEIIVLGPTMKGKLLDEGITEEQINVIPQPLFVNISPSKADGCSIRAKFDVPDSARLVLFVGYFKRSKGPYCLIDTIEFILKRSSNIHFLIVGSGGPHEDTVFQSFADADKVKFAGWVNHDELGHYYDAADVLLQTSQTEGLPNVILEALTYGVPVVATDSGGEVRHYISNIGSTPAELGDLVMREDDLTLDPLPEAATEPTNGELYRMLFRTVTTDE